MDLWRKLRGKSSTGAAERLYHSVVHQARQPDFYLKCGVPDTVDGRFDLIALHAFLVMRRLRGPDEENARLAQALFDVMFADMDRNLREMGTGDLSLGRKIRQLTEIFYGRIKAYEDGLATDAEAGQLAQALRRNLFRKSEPNDRQVGAIARYVTREVSQSGQWDLDALRTGQLSFGPPPRPARESGGAGGRGQ